MACPIETKSGFCQILGAHVTLQWCQRRCIKRLGGMPSMPQMGLNLAKASIKHLATGLKHRSPEEAERLLAICTECSNYVIINDKARCKHTKCGCYLVNKVKWASQRCPEGKW